MPLIEAKTQSDYFIGNVVNLEAQSNLDFNYISAQRKGQEVFKVNHNGDIITAGSIRVDGQIDIRNDLSLGGRQFVEYTSVSAGDVITIPESSILRLSMMEHSNIINSCLRSVKELCCFCRIHWLAG
jgi:hypothetical protein